jgi:tetratricopeptide (TPR) repeat protein
MRILAPCAALVLLAAGPAHGEPSAEARSRKLAGDQRRAAGDAAGALEAYRGALQADGGYADAHYGLAEAYRGLGDRGAAIASFERFIALAQERPDEARRVTQASEAVSQLRAEEIAARSAAPGFAPAPPSLAPDATVVIAPAPVAMPAAAPSIAPRAAAVDPRPAARAKLRLGDSFAAVGDTRLALFAYQDAVNLDPRSAEARMRLAGLYARIDRLEQAVDQWSFALALDPSLEEARRNIASARAALEGRARPPEEPPRPRIYKLTPDLEPAPQPPPASPRGP